MKKSLCILLSLFVFNSCNALKSITDGETELDPEFFVGADSLYSGLIDFWRFDETSGSANKKSVTGNTTLFENSSGLSSQNGKFGNSIDCSGGATSNYLLKSVAYSDNTRLDKNYSLSFWIYPYSLTGTSYILTTGGSDNINLFFGDLDTNGDDADIRLDFGSLYSTQIVDVFGSTGVFYHVAFITEGDSIRLYIDGVDYGQYFSGSRNAFSITTFGLCSNGGGGNIADMRIDSFGFWERALTYDEVQRLYTGDNPLD